MAQVRTISDLREEAAAYLNTFSDPAKGYAWRTYDQAGVHDGPLTAADVLMAVLLSLPLRWADVTPLFADGDMPHARLRRALDAALVEARSLPALEDCSDEQLAMPALTDAIRATVEVPNWTGTTVSKVLHRLAPTVPITDSYTRAFYRVTRQQGPIYRQRLRDDLRSNRSWLAELAEHHPVRGQPAPLCRIADIVIWMSTKTSRGRVTT
jgi:Family of unknown function (DUF6308)